MQLITLATLLASIASQDILIRTVNGPMALDQSNGECLNFSGTAISSEVKARGKLILYKNKGCSRGSYAWSTGNFDYKPYYEFNSVKFIPSSRRVYGDSNGSQAPGASSDSDDSNGGGEADGEPSYYYNQGYNYNNYNDNNYNNHRYNDRYPGRYY
jgi:hypothetical protein